MQLYDYATQIIAPEHFDRVRKKKKNKKKDFYSVSPDLDIRTIFLLFRIEYTLSGRGSTEEFKMLRDSFISTKI